MEYFGKFKSMFKSYFKTAWRYLTKNRSHSLINILGLAVGMAAAMLIALWIWDELTFDRYFDNYHLIAQVEQNRTFNGVIHTDKATPIPLATELKTKYGSQFKYIVLSSWTNEHILSNHDNNEISMQGNFMGADAPDMLTLRMIAGTRDGLKDASSLFLSRSAATTLFGSSDPMGKIVRLDSFNMKVKGVYQDLPYNSSFRDVSFIASWDQFVSSQPWVKDATTDWGRNSFQIFARISDNQDMKELSARIKNVKLENAAGEVTLKPEIFLFPMERWHLYAEFKDGVSVGGAIQVVWMFGVIDVFILLLACINFMNLSTARSEKRAKEVGIRKAVGSTRGGLIGQFFAESIMVALFAFVMALILVIVALLSFNSMADKRMHILWANPFFWLLGIGFSLITGFIAGSYPAFYLSSFQSVKVLKGTFKAGPRAALPRKILVVLQFTVSVILIIGTIVVFRQIQFAKNRPIGYDNNGLVMVRALTRDLHDHFEAIREELVRSGAISEMAESSSPVTRVSRTTSGFNWKGKDPAMSEDFVTTGITPEYGKTVGWQFLAGRDFDKTFSTDSTGIVLNEAAVKYTGLKDPVGENILWDDKSYKVLGVVKDMIMGSPYEAVKQTIFYLN